MNGRSATFTRKFELIFVLTQENTFSYRFRFKTNRKSIGCCDSETNFLRKENLFQ